MTTQLPNGYEAVKVPEGISRVSISDDYEGPNALSYMVNEHWYYSALPSTGYRLIGRADELTEEQAKMIVKKIDQRDSWSEGFTHEELKQVSYQDYTDEYGTFDTALESFDSLLDCLDLEPHTTIILKKENV